MADNKPAGQSGQPTTPKAAEQPRQGNSGQNEDPTTGLGAATEAAHKARVEVPGHPGIDARLDNRTGAQRPPLETWPAKPQQVDGPDVAHQAEHTRKTLAARDTDLGDRKGAFSPGPHGLSEPALRETDEPKYGPEGLSAAEVAKGAKG